MGFGSYRKGSDPTTCIGWHFPKFNVAELVPVDPVTSNAQGKTCSRYALFGFRLISKNQCLMLSRNIFTYICSTVLFFRYLPSTHMLIISGMDLPGAHARSNGTIRPEAQPQRYAPPPPPQSQWRIYENHVLKSFHANSKHRIEIWRIVCDHSKFDLFFGQNPKGRK